MLRTRVITALTLLPIVLIALFWFPPWAWGIFVASIVGTAAWEWRRLCRFKGGGGAVFQYLLTIAATCVMVLFVYGVADNFVRIAMPLLAIACVMWVLIVPLWLLQTWRAPWPLIDALAGAVLLLATLVALLQLHEISPWLLLSFGALVWAADIAAYFSGKAFGKHKLAPAISPGKTIEGVIGGLLGVTAYFFLWRWLTTTYAADQTWTKPLHAQGIFLLVFFLLLGLISVLGDLFESWMKRGAGLKDSSNLLPGHGGILDRIDALTSTLPVAALYMMLISPRA